MAGPHPGPDDVARGAHVRSRTGSIASALLAGLLLVGGFVPQHIMLWEKFPVWYHLTFLVSLVPLVYVGGQFSAPWQGAVPRPIEMP